MKTLKDTGLLFNRYSLQMLRNPVWLFVGFSTPVLYLALFTPLLRHIAPQLGVGTGSVLDLFLPGILALLAFASGSSMGFSTIFELQAGVIERFRVTPASRFAILMGPIVSGLTMMMVFDAVVVAIGVGVGFRVNWPGILLLAVVLALLASLMAAFSTATALVTKDISSFAAVINGINLPILLLAGVLLPISIGPRVDAGHRALQPALLHRAGLAGPRRGQLRIRGSLAGIRRPRPAVRLRGGVGDEGVQKGRLLTRPLRGSVLSDHDLGGLYDGDHGIALARTRDPRQNPW